MTDRCSSGDLPTLVANQACVRTLSLMISAYE